MHLDWIAKAGFGINSVSLWASAIDIHLRIGDATTAGKLLQLALNLLGPLGPSVRILATLAEHALVAHLDLASEFARASNYISPSVARRSTFANSIKSYRHPFTLVQAEVFLDLFQFFIYLLRIVIDLKWCIFKNGFLEKL